MKVFLTKTMHGLAMLLAAFRLLTALLICPIFIFIIWFYNRPQPQTELRSLGQGIIYLRLALQSPRPIVMHLVQIDLKSMQLERVLVTPADNCASGRPLKARATSDFAAEHDLDLAINGDFFKPFYFKSFWDYAPRAGDCVSIESFAMSDGKAYGTELAEQNLRTVYLSPDLVPITQRPVWLPDKSAAGMNKKKYLWQAISGHPALMHNGRIRIPLDENLLQPYYAHAHPRTVMAWNKERGLMFWLVVDGRQPGYSMGMTIPEVVQVLSSLGARNIINLDGGGSSTLVWRNPDTKELQVLNSPIHTNLPGRERPVANHLGIRLRN